MEKFITGVYFAFFGHFSFFFLWQANHMQFSFPFHRQSFNLVTWSDVAFPIKGCFNTSVISTKHTHRKDYVGVKELLKHCSASVNTMEVTWSTDGKTVKCT